ncbi:MAG: hypothetical protein QGI25_11095, partial [Arenicellales bacterium]|nr:hypothetical protein [Arenicellales bacterium]
SDSVLSRLWSLVRRLRGQVHELRGRIRGLEAELAEVRERLQRNSGNIIDGRLYVAGGSLNGGSVHPKMWVTDAPE